MTNGPQPVLGMKNKSACFSRAGILLALVFGLYGLSVNAQPAADAQMVYQLQQLQDEIRELRGLVEQQSFELENLKRRQRDQYLDLDQRLNDIRQGGAGIAAAGSTTADADQPVISQPVIEQPVVSQAAPEVRAPQVEQREVASIALPATGAAAVTQASPEDEKRAYDSAFSALKDLRYADSAQAFLDFIEQYPDSEYADNAQYWLGESFYAAGNYDLALNAFNGLLADYPRSSKTADALLKIGYSHYEKKEWPQARAALEQVKAQYPETTLSRLAESRLRNMRLEGHF